MSELRDALSSANNFDASEIEHLFAEIDFDHTGTISYHEFIAAAMSKSSIREENIKLAFEKISNHNEFITIDDLKALLGADAKSERVRKFITLTASKYSNFYYIYALASRGHAS